MTTLFGIAVVQMHVVPWDTEKTLDKMEQRLHYIRRSFPSIQLVCFPELCASATASVEPLPEGQTWDSSAEEIPGPISERLCEMARRHGLWLQPGSIYERAGDDIYNTALVYSPDGELVTRYRKLFPWRPWETTSAGSEFCVFDIPNVGRFGLCICYDAWFPEVMRTLMWMGAEVILHPTLTSTADRDAELIIERASAIFNQCYVVTANVSPTAGCGRSTIVDPNGRTLHEAGTGEAIVTEVIDLDLVRQVRNLGTHGLNQHLKQLRDFEGEFPIYAQGIDAGALFQGLGPLKLPRQLNSEKE